MDKRSLEQKHALQAGWMTAPSAFGDGRPRLFIFWQALESDGMDMEIDLSNLGTVNTMFAALFSKLGVPIKTTISATVLEDALNGTVTVRPLPIGISVSGKVEKQCAHFFGVTVLEEQAQAGREIFCGREAVGRFEMRQWHHATRRIGCVSVDPDKPKPDIASSPKAVSKREAVCCVWWDAWRDAIGASQGVPPLGVHKKFLQAGIVVRVTSSSQSKFKVSL